MNDFERLRNLGEVYGAAAFHMDADRYRDEIFWPRATITRADAQGALSVTPVEEWLETIRAHEPPRTSGVPFESIVRSIDDSGDLALIKVRLSLGTSVYWDLLSCLKVEGDWRIVQKVSRVESIA